MAQLRTCSFNCRGWNNGLHTLSHFIDSLDLCFLQEHWLLRDQLHLINNISPDLLSVSVCGMDNSELVCGRPYGGCSICIGSLLPHVLPFLILVQIVSVVSSLIAHLVCPTTNLRFDSS